MSILKVFNALAGGVILALAVPASAQDIKDLDAEDIAKTPLQDLNLEKDEIPEVLVMASDDPYNSQGLINCNSIVGEIAKLDTILGDDYDLRGAEDTGMDANKAAKRVVGSFIPFRGIVREVTGAAGDERKARAAVTAGLVRRGFLKGLGQSRGCEYPARPKDPAARE
ncbi:MAG: hypothetical protein AAF127_02805 [Pseudomonadota bacterium]